MPPQDQQPQNTPPIDPTLSPETAAYPTTPAPQLKKAMSKPALVAIVAGIVLLVGAIVALLIFLNQSSAEQEPTQATTAKEASSPEVSESATIVYKPATPEQAYFDNVAVYQGYKADYQGTSKEGRALVADSGNKACDRVRGGESIYTSKDDPNVVINGADALFAVYTLCPELKDSYMAGVTSEHTDFIETLTDVVLDGTAQPSAILSAQAVCMDKARELATGAFWTPFRQQTMCTNFRGGVDTDADYVQSITEDLPGLEKAIKTLATEAAKAS